MSILFCTPMYGGNCLHSYFKSALNLHGFMIREDVDHDFYTLWNESAVHRARNQCVKAFLETKFEYLFFIDADIEFTIDDVGRIWNLGQEADISVGLYRMKRDDAPFAAWVDGKLVTMEDITSPDSPVQAAPRAVDYAGTGFMLIHRRVLEHLCTDENKYEGKDGPMHQVFDFPLRGGVELSEDYAFCEDARNAGYKVMMDTNVRLKHWGIKAY